MSPLRLRQVHKAMTRPLHIGLLGAMPEEIGSDLSHLKQPSSKHHGDLTLHHGVWGDGVRLTLAWSGWGKVCAARAATRLLAAAPDLDLLLFTGVAGAADDALQQWDVIFREKDWQWLTCQQWDINTREKDRKWQHQQRDVILREKDGQWLFRQQWDSNTREKGRPWQHQTKVGRHPAAALEFGHLLEVTNSYLSERPMAVRSLGCKKLRENGPQWNCGW